MNRINYPGERKRTSLAAALFVLVELVFIVFFASLVLPDFTLAAIGNPVTVNTQLTVGNSAPEILNVSVNAGAQDIDLTANDTTRLVIVAVIQDFNGEDDIINVTSEFFDNVNSSYGASDDNNNHYTNATCVIDTSFGDATQANATCIYDVWYYANNATWNMSFFVTDNSSLTDFGGDIITVNTLLAVGLPDTIDYGEVNSTAVSPEQVANVTNFGNVRINITLEGYARTQGDPYAFNCSFGSVQNISVGFERYNLTASNDTNPLTLAQFDQAYRNLTNASVTREFNLNYRHNDTTPLNDDTNSTYWRVYVPVGVAGSCTGNIIFGATVGAAS